MRELKEQIEHYKDADRWIFNIVVAWFFVTLNRVITLWRLGNTDEIGTNLGIAIAVGFLPLGLGALIGAPLHWLLTKICPGYKGGIANPSSVVAEFDFTFKDFCLLMMLILAIFYRQSEKVFSILLVLLFIAEIACMLLIFMTAVADACTVLYRAVKAYNTQAEAELSLNTEHGGASTCKENTCAN